jgi:hypothetical protein
MDGGWMKSSKSRRVLQTTAAGLALFLVACNRQPAVEKNDAGPSASPTTVGTSGQTAPSETATASQATSSAASTTPASTTERDPDAVKALERMGDYLRTLKSFQIRSATSRDEVLDDGQNVEYDGLVDMIVDRPNRLRAEVTSDKQQRTYFYNGSSLSIWAPRVNYFAMMPAPPTIRELADTLTSKYDIELPLVDLFYWSDRKSTADIVSATDLGASQVDGVTCQHYAYRQEGADWQVWIQLGGYPLPRKLVIRTTTDEARPRFAAVMAWNLAPSFNDAAFTFVPPSDAHKIIMAEVPGFAERGSGH